MNPAHNERIKLAATALNNLGVAAIVTGAIAPTAAYLTGTLGESDPLRLLSLAIVWLATSLVFFIGARHILGGMV